MEYMDLTDHCPQKGDSVAAKSIRILYMLNASEFCG